MSISFQIYIQIHLIILRATYYIFEYSPGSHSRKARQQLISPSAIIVLVHVEVTIIFVEGNAIHVELIVGDRGKYIR